MWTCPSCGAPQAETARCWVCRRSSTTCSTCAHFRRALAGDLGYCGRDARRRPMTGQELRGCWQPNADSPEVTVLSNLLDEASRVRRGRAPVPAYRPGEASGAREFVPIESLTRTEQPERPPAPGAEAEPPAPFVVESEPRWTDQTSLFGEREA